MAELVEHFRFGGDPDGENGPRWRGEGSSEWGASRGRGAREARQRRVAGSERQECNVMKQGGQALLNYLRVADAPNKSQRPT